jgi:Protein of unknown function (DUF3795)
VNSEQSGNSAADKRLAAVCGLFCPACSVFIGTMEDPARLITLAGRFQMPSELLECHGCRSEKRALYCNKYCRMTKCTAEKGIEFCGECGEYPCSELKAFQAQMPHRIELWQSHLRIKKVGWEKWYGEMIEHYSCPECRTINSAYDIACRKCGRTPSCEYIRLHEDVIALNSSKMGL